MNGCHNRAPLSPALSVQDGWTVSDSQDTRQPRMISIPFRMSQRCEYALSDLGKKDAACVGCKWVPS